jgi:hypothetical protein
MPCYTKIQTLLIDLKIIEQAAGTLGITVTKRTANSYTLKRGDEQVTIERTQEGEKFYTSVYSGSNNFESQIIQPLTLAYAKERVKQFAKGKGYTVSAGSKPNTYVLSKYG